MVLHFLTSLTPCCKDEHWDEVSCHTALTIHLQRVGKEVKSNPNLKTKIPDNLGFSMNRNFHLHPNWPPPLEHVWYGAVWMPADKRRRRHVDAFVAGMMRKMEFVLAIYGTTGSTPLIASTTTVHTNHGKGRWRSFFQFSWWSTIHANPNCCLKFWW